MVSVLSCLVIALVLAISVVSCAAGKGLADSGGQKDALMLKQSAAD